MQSGVRVIFLVSRFQWAMLAWILEYVLATEYSRNRVDPLLIDEETLARPVCAVVAALDLPSRQHMSACLCILNAAKSELVRAPARGNVIRHPNYTLYSAVSVWTETGYSRM